MVHGVGNIQARAEAVMEGRLGCRALLDDAVFDACVAKALGVERRAAQAQVRQHEADLQAAVAERFGKRSEQMSSIFGVSLETVAAMSEPQLIMYSRRVQEGLAGQALSPIEKAQYTEFAGHLREAMTTLATSKEQASKALMAQSQDDDPVQEAPPPAKNKGKTVNDGGKTAYKYDKQNGGKGPGKQPKSKKGPKQAAAPKGGDAPEEGAAPPDITPPPPVDPKALATALDVKVSSLKKLARDHTREQFTQVFMSHPNMVKKFNLTATYLSGLYDALTAPPAAPPANTPPGVTKQPPAAAAAQAAGQPAAKPKAAAPANGKVNKAVLHFVGSSVDPESQTLLKLLKKHRVRNHDQMQGVLKSHFALSDDQALHLSRTLLRRWESEAVVDLKV